MLYYARLTCVLALTAVALSAQSVAVGPVLTTGVIGLADAQTAQLNLLNPGVEAPAVGVICAAVVSFVAGDGTVLKTSPILNVIPGTSQAFDLRSDIDLKLLAGDRREIRATITFPPVATPTGATSSTPTLIPCKLIPTLEIFDTVSGRTLVSLGYVEHVPAAPGPVSAP
jgi:hypothetical protein